MLPTNCLSVFDQFVGLALKGLSFGSLKPRPRNYVLGLNYTLRRYNFRKFRKNFLVKNLWMTIPEIKLHLHIALHEYLEKKSPDVFFTIVILSSSKINFSLTSLAPFRVMNYLNIGSNELQFCCQKDIKNKSKVCLF